ncbi:hypothetical protein C7B64_01290 [Merismopedia glauca CCAP 1448/3]|uniref:Uncharacterized protein n=1 Tax=Merismopedia glauca CCAP 1448/3 TaxID=1296344 RepID=A0A2T1CA67_9CYAN|nr:hypothetical protein C7B64_01290 [Merismopedia glauca CCAP 1448/3]
MQTHNYRLTCSQLPLAVYREIAAHLQQVKGVSVRLITQTSQEFSYYTSQIEAMSLNFVPDLSEGDRQRVAQILDYYAQNHGNWEIAATG